jgi:hypothetical protein
MVLSPTIFTVNSTGSGTLGSGTSGTLPYVISQANANTNTDGSEIEFDPSVFSSQQTITLGATLVLSETTGPEVIDGPGAGLATISGGGAVRVFEVESGVTASISGVTISRGSTTGPGGGLENYGAATLTGCTISGNSAGIDGDGGGLENDGTATLTGCTISGNSAGDVGGGLDNKGTMTLTNCTVSGNSARLSGGGLKNYGTATLTNCTVSGNSAGLFGGIDNLGSTVTIGNTIVAENSAPNAPDAFGTFASQGNNLIGETDGSSGWVGSDLTGTVAQPLNAEVAPLGD